MSEKRAPRDDDDDEIADGIVAADDTGMIANEILLTDVQLLEGENHPDAPTEVPLRVR